MRPQDQPRVAVALREVREQRLDGLGHVPVAQVPRRQPRTEQRAVVLLGVACQPRVLFGGERVVPVPHGALPQLLELLDRRALALRRETQPRRVAVSLRIAPVIIEARIPLPRFHRGGRIDGVQM